MKISKYVEKSVIHVDILVCLILRDEFTGKLYHFVPRLSEWDSPPCSTKNLTLAFVHPPPGMSQSYGG